MGRRGFFISLEGVEGTGKSTQAGMLSEALMASGMRTVLTAEPGGTALADKIRGLLLDVSHDGMEPMTELLLYSAARRQHLSELIIPALEAGDCVITDRFSDSTMAYQGYGRGIDRGLIERLDSMVTGTLRPELTLLLDLDVREGLSRNREASKVDRLELEDLEFHERVRRGFLEIARSEPRRLAVIDASEGVDKVHRAIMEAVRTRLELSP
jgi:dTMP kinase